MAEEKGKREIVHYIDKDIIDTYYKPAPFGGVYELKSEYLAKCDKFWFVKYVLNKKFYYKLYSIVFFEA